MLQSEIEEPLGLKWFEFGVSPDDSNLVAQNVETGLPLGFAIGSIMKRVLGRP